MSKVRQLFIFFLFILIGCQTNEPVEENRISLEQCRVGERQLCGQLEVWENRVEQGDKISLNIVVYPALSSLPEADPIFLLAGGPGQAATEVFPFLIPFLNEMGQDRDIVLLDQRGTGRSNPLQCNEFDEVEIDAFRDEDLVEQLLKKCRARLGAEHDLTQYVTDIAIADLEEVREGLGYEQINLIGTSYGTRVALRYIALHPEQIRSVILNGVAGPNLMLQMQSPRDGSRAWGLLVDRCQRDVGCNEYFPDIEADLNRLLQLIGDGVEVKTVDPTTNEADIFFLTQENFLSYLFTGMYSPELVSLLPLLINQTVESEDFTLLMGQYLFLNGQLQFYMGMQYAVVCSEDAPYIDLDEAAKLAEGGLFESSAAQFVENCADWPQAELPADFRAFVSSDIPVLLLSGEADPITPPQYGDDVAAHLSNQKHIILPGFGHDVLLAGCMPTVAADFIVAGGSDGLDDSCLDGLVPPPFFVSFNGPLP